MSTIQVISEAVEDKIWFLTQEYDTEWMGILKGYRNGEDYIVEDIVIPRQTNTAAHTRADEPTVGKKIVGWVHSHNVMDAFFSQEDIDHAEMLPVAIVVNKARNVKGLVGGKEADVLFTGKMVHDSNGWHHKERGKCAREEATGKNFLTDDLGISDYVCPKCTYQEACHKRCKEQTKVFLKKEKALKTWHRKVKPFITGKAKPDKRKIKIVKKDGMKYGKYAVYHD